MIRGMLEPGSGASSAAHQLSEPNSFCFLSSSTAASSPPAERTTAQAAKPEPLALTPSSDSAGTSPWLAPDSVLDRSSTPRPLTEERNSTPRPALPAEQPSLDRSGSYTFNNSTGNERDRSAGGCTSGSSGAMSSFHLSPPSSATTESRPPSSRFLVDPPTPLALPGGWTARESRGAARARPEAGLGERAAHDLRWRIVRTGANKDSRGLRADEDSDGAAADEALVLPPPFLTTDSPRESFDGTPSTPFSRLGRPSESRSWNGRLTLASRRSTWVPERSTSESDSSAARAPFRPRTRSASALSSQRRPRSSQSRPSPRSPWRLRRERPTNRRGESCTAEASEDGSRQA